MEKQTKSVHLFNCDNTFDLDSVESLFTAVTDKLDFDISIKKHYFGLSQMAKMSDSTVPDLQMDYAVFVVHAHESRLSINEDNAGIGYAKIYRALLQATGDNVIIVIGGDDNYKDEGEESKVVLSRWARRKISSQFSGEYLDGRKSFVFSWDERHRDIHEEALLHYFDPIKKEQKFEHQDTRKGEIEVEEPANDEQNSVPADIPVPDSGADNSHDNNSDVQGENGRQPSEEDKEDRERQYGSPHDNEGSTVARRNGIPWWKFWRRCMIL